MADSRMVGVLYIPVFHKGYSTFLKELETRGVQELFVISDSILEKHEALDYIHRKDRIRAVGQDEMLTLLRSITKLTVSLLTEATITDLQKGNVEIITPKEDIGSFIVETYFTDHVIKYHPIFLRRHKDNIGESKAPEAHEMSLSEFQKNVVGKIREVAERSADWWRQVGAALVKDGEIIAIAHNEHMPEAQLPNIIGDSRALFHKGDHINYVTTAHAEVGAIAEAARKGMVTEGAEIFVTDFPCPYCARLIAKSGIKKVYFMRGYAVLDGDDFFNDMGIELVRIEEKASQ